MHNVHLVLVSRYSIKKIRFEENQPYEMRVFLAEILISYQVLLSRFFHESEAKETEAKVAETVNRLMEHCKYSDENNLRQTLIRGCLLNMDYLTVRKISRTPGFRIFSDALFFIFIFLGFYHRGSSFWMAFACATFFTSLVIIIKRKVIWPWAWWGMREEAKEQANQSMPSGA